MGFVMNYRGDQSTSSQAGKFISYLIVAAEDKSTFLAKQSMADRELATTTITSGGKVVLMYLPSFNHFT